MLFGLADPAISGEVRDAHEAAVDAALDYMERHAAVGRRGRAGTESVLGNGFLATASVTAQAEPATPNSTPTSWSRT